MRYKGKVVRQAVSVGSKSEHEAVVLLTEEGPIKLRRVGGNPFSDPVLEKLVGHEITCDAKAHAGQLLMSKWDIVE